MKRHLLFVHGAGERAHDEDMKMVESLRDALGSGYETRFREFDGRGHQFEDDLSEVAHDIVSLERTGS